MRVVDKLAWIHVQDGRLLCARSRGKTAFFVPGGKREAEESDEDALVREIREELSVTLVRGTIERAGVFEAAAHGQPDAIVRLTCFTGDYEGTLTAAAEIEEIAWLTSDDLGRVSEVTRMVIEWLDECRTSSTSSSKSRS